MAKLVTYFLAFTFLRVIVLVKLKQIFTLSLFILDGVLIIPSLKLLLLVLLAS